MWTDAQEKRALEKELGAPVGTPSRFRPAHLDCVFSSWCSQVVLAITFVLNGPRDGRGTFWWFLSSGGRRAAPAHCEPQERAGAASRTES